MSNVWALANDFSRLNLISSRAVSFHKLDAQLCVIGELLVEVEAVTLLLAESLQEIFTDRHLVEVCVVRQEALFVLAR